MDVYIEQLIAHKRNSKETLMNVGTVVGAVVIIMLLYTVLPLLVASLSDSIRAIIGTLRFVAAALIIYFAVIMIRNRMLEFEYVMTNSELDIDKIIAKNGRKRVVSFDFKSIEICAAADDFSYKAEYENTSGLARIYDLTGNQADGGVYFADFVGEGGRQRVLFQPNRDILEAAWKYNPRSVHVKE